MTVHVPEEVQCYITRIFSQLNDKISTKMSLVPNIPEETLDISLIEHLSQYSAPKIVGPNWAVRIAAHFIGRLRHYGRYEVADIGVAVVFKKSGRTLAKKLILLQSKRLYPTNHDVIELEDYDYQLGLALIVDRDDSEASLFSNVTYTFDETSSYGALRANSHQCNLIAAHIEETSIPVHYLMYNPLSIPWSLSYPAGVEEVELPNRDVGIQIVPAESVHDILNKFSDGVALRWSDLCPIDSHGCMFGSSLEEFIAEVIQCRKGHLFDGADDVEIHRLFSRKSGPIFGIVEVAIEQVD